MLESPFIPNKKNPKAKLPWDFFSKLKMRQKLLLLQQIPDLSQ